MVSAATRNRRCLSLSLSRSLARSHSRARRAFSKTQPEVAHLSLSLARLCTLDLSPSRQLRWCVRLAPNVVVLSSR
jgi:hypothetical protein